MSSRRLHRVGLVAAPVALALAACAPGAAAAQSALRVGVPIDGLLPADHARVDVAVPAEPGAVTVTFARTASRADGAQVPAVAVEVLVAEDVPAAEAWLAFARDTVAGALAPTPGVGDDAWGTASFVAFRRGNVGVTVRGLLGQDVLALARHVDDHVRGGPAGPPASRPTIAWTVDPAAAEANGGVVPLPDALVAGRLDVEGPGYARRTRGGWVLIRTGPGALRVRPVGVDRLLRLVIAPGG